ncbi:MAG TPA: hypothetical protein VE093_06485 [Polyangiaceae bacterium]|jgi:hypothetical protein|nr:hypothetical protein [Polyangiaceae bacterium]
MASISLNPRIQDRVTYNVVQTFKHDHKVNIVKGAFVALAIVGVGVFSLVAPAFGPAWGEAQQVASEVESSRAESSQVEYDAP